MTTSSRPQEAEAPIYDSLIEEHGDIPEETRQVAERVRREASEAVDFSCLQSRSEIASSQGEPEYLSLWDPRF
ncbi:hypothetical protein AB0P36_35610 [Streptomyces flavidovirens]|uniref:hypothetical protein n=1 Tax=Streptomyces flavidovirens TaxID=67298 RepID=UPI00343AAEF4